MTVKISIIGLGQIGTSVGLALADHSDLVQRVGHDRDRKIARKCQKLRAMDKVEHNLHKAVEGADLVLLSLPIDQIRETLELIAGDLKAGSVVMDTAPVKEIVSTWTKEILPKGSYYIGLTPVLNPSYLHEVDSGLEAAHADLFRDGLIGIVAHPTTSAGAIKLAADLTHLLGAAPFYVDPLEMDGLMAATHTLPQLIAAALLNATVDQPGWRESSKVAGRPYAEVTGPIMQLGESHSLTSSALFNQENMLRVMDSTIAALQVIRNDIEAGDAASLDERLGRAQKGREEWWVQKQAGDLAGEKSGKERRP